MSGYHAIETIPYHGGRIEIHQDDHQGDSPRDWGNVGTMICWHPDYTLGDHQEGVHRVRELIAPPTCHKCGDSIREAHGAWWHSNGLMFCRDSYWNTRGDLVPAAPDEDTYPTIAAWLVAEYDAIPETILPLGLIDHSGISMYVGGGAHPCDPGGWDSGTVGYIFATQAQLDETGCPADRIDQALRIEVQTYDDYLTGSVYGYVTYGADGREAGSCWSFYPEHPDKRTGDYWRDELGYMLSEAEAEVDAANAAMADEIATAMHRHDAALATDGLWPMVTA